MYIHIYTCPHQYYLEWSHKYPASLQVWGCLLQLWGHLWPKSGAQFFFFDIHVIQSYSGWKKSCTSWQVVYPTVFRVSTIQGGAGFLPSTVCAIVKLQFFSSNGTSTRIFIGIYKFYKTINLGTPFLMAGLPYHIISKATWSWQIQSYGEDFGKTLTGCFYM